jgi:hypothetical protein
MTSNGKTPNTKVVDLRKLRNFVVDKFLIWIRLVPLKTDLHSVLYNMSRTKTAYERIWVCGVVVEEASREVEVTGSNHGNRGASRLYAKKCATCDLVTETICAGTRSLAGAPPASKDRLWPSILLQTVNEFQLP